MRTQSIKNQERISPPLAGVVGGISGYALKYALPFSNFEMENVKDEHSISVVNNAQRHARKLEYKKIMEEGVSQEIEDVFVKSKNAILDNEFKPKDIDENIMKTLSGFLKRIDDKGINEKECAEKMVKALEKSNRSSFYFIAFGAIIFMSVATLANGLKEARNQK